MWHMHAMNVEEGVDSWYLDSGALAHVTKSGISFQKLTSTYKISKVRSVKGHSHVVVGEGIVNINYPVANQKI